MHQVLRSLLALVFIPVICVFAADDAPPPPPAKPRLVSSVTAYIKMVITKEYGFLAHVAGKRNSTVISKPYDPANPNWWENPLVIYAEPPVPPGAPAPSCPCILGCCDLDCITGTGVSSNARVSLNLVPHVDVNMAALPGCDGMKGTLTVRIRADASFFDGEWTPMLTLAEKTVTFAIDTCDPNRAAKAVAHEVRTFPVWAFERYTRSHEKWEPQTAWPAAPKNGDWQAKIYGTDAKLDVTGFRYTN